jgi:catechol 2,3-dioxygenase-like lactoylglutathione lyase family enzyme
MERFIANLIRDFEGGKIDGRQFCEAVAIAAAVHAAGEHAANAAPAQGFSPISINHISYACPDYRKARDFYTSVLGMEPAPKSDNGKETHLMFGPPPGKGGSFLIPRNGRTTTNAKGVIDHVCYAIADWDETRVQGALAAKGLSITRRDGSLHVNDPFDYDVELANADRLIGFQR